MTQDFSFLEADSVSAARRLLGCTLERTHEGGTTIVKIVETEAYHQSDAASHSYKGRTPRTDVMFGPPGFLYVYFTYGMHYCMNIVTGHEGEGAAVLIRAVEPLEGAEYIRQNRPGQLDVQTTNGPAKTCQALRIDTTYNGHNLQRKPLRLVVQSPVPHERVVQTTRIGISQAQEQPWRFYIAGNPFVSRR